MIARGDGFPDLRCPVSVQARQQDGALHLGARDLGHERNRLQQAGAVNRERWPAIRGVDDRAHAFERHDDPSHGPPPQGVVSGNRAAERVGGEDARQHAHGAARIAGIQGRRRRGESPQPPPANPHVEPTVIPRPLVYRDTKSPKASEGRGAVGSGRISTNRGDPVSHRRQKGVPVGDGFVARRPHLAPEAGGGLHDDTLRFGHHRTITGGLFCGIRVA